MIFHQPISVTDLLNKIRLQTFPELLFYIGQITVARANVHKQPLIWVPQILNTQLEALGAGGLAEYLFPQTQRLSFSVQNVRQEEPVFKSHASPFYAFSTTTWTIKPQEMGFTLILPEKGSGGATLSNCSAAHLSATLTRLWHCSLPAQ